MNPYALASLVVGVLALFATAIIQLNSSVEKKIEQRLSDPQFIMKVASEVRLPFLIFDEDNRYLADFGGSELIHEIRVDRKDARDLKEIVVTPKRAMPIAPIIESYNETTFEDPVKGEKLDWIYRAVEPETAWASTYPSGKQPKRRFKLQIIPAQ
jgi:hypothetical protein